MKIKTSFTLLSAIALPLACLGKDVDISKLPPPADRQGVTYEKDIRPIFEQSCVKCHGPQKPKAKLRLDSLGGILKGSEDGKVLHPGDSAKSILVHNVAHLSKNPDDWMPPTKNRMGIKPLTQEQIALIRAWIDQGAK